MILAEQSWTKIRDLLDGSRPVVALLPCGATEAHGPHLPLNTDVIISEGMARRAVPLLAAKAIAALILPPLAYAPADCAAAFPGTLTVSAVAARQIILDIASGLKQQGFACLALANSHFDPANVAMLRDAAEGARGCGLPIAFPDFTRRKLAQLLTDEFISGACHAGQYETSLVMADQPMLVDENMRHMLADNPSSLVAAFAHGATNFTDAGGPDAYFGSPAKATMAEGNASYAVMATILADTVIESLLH
ncbi:MAG: creatininase family protein [Pseudomonadota bacterium]